MLPLNNISNIEEQHAVCFPKLGLENSLHNKLKSIPHLAK